MWRLPCRWYEVNSSELSVECRQVRSRFPAGKWNSTPTRRPRVSSKNPRSSSLSPSSSRSTLKFIYYITSIMLTGGCYCEAVRIEVDGELGGGVVS